MAMSVDWVDRKRSAERQIGAFDPVPVRKSAFTQPLRVAQRPSAPQPSKCQREITFVLSFQSHCANSVARRLEQTQRRNSLRGSHDQSGPPMGGLIGGKHRRIREGFLE